VSPQFSVIIPSLEEGRYIRRTLGQFPPALKERFRIEVIVSDGGSTDDTLDLARRLADVVLQADRGERENIAIGRNRGARVARGEILVFINADVMIDQPEQFFASMRDVLEEPGISAATCNVRIYREEERLVDRCVHGFFNWYFRLLNSIGFGMGRGECHVMKRELFAMERGYNERLAAGEDFELYSRLRKLGKIRWLRSVTVYESPRRFRKSGYARVIGTWMMNAVAVMVFGKSYSKRWEAVR
jgi:glycosyltransferase involved in cell wall biosynthesis